MIGHPLSRRSRLAGWGRKDSFTGSRAGKTHEVVDVRLVPFFAQPLTFGRFVPLVRKLNIPRATISDTMRVNYAPTASGYPHEPQVEVNSLPCGVTSSRSNGLESIAHIVNSSAEFEAIRGAHDVIPCAYPPEPVGKTCDRDAERF
jgi:hypothetical protein